jgi:hypothetical protein
VAAWLRALPRRMGADALLAAAIAMVSVLGAVAAYTASVADQEGNRLLRLAVLETAQREQITSVLVARVDHDMRELPGYAEHLTIAATLDTQASKSSDVQAKQALQQQAAGERAIAHTLQHFFLVRQPDVAKNADGSVKVTYDQARAMRTALAENNELRTLDPEASKSAGEAQHRKSVALTSLLVVFALALLLFTVARFVRVSWRSRMVIPATVLTLGATAAMLAVQRWA